MRTSRERQSTETFFPWAYCQWTTAAIAPIAIVLNSCAPAMTTHAVAIDVKFHNGKSAEKTTIALRSHKKILHDTTFEAIAAKSALESESALALLQDITATDSQGIQLKVREVGKETCKDKTTVHVRLSEPYDTNLISIAGEPVNMVESKSLSNHELEVGFLYSRGRAPEPTFINKLRRSFPALNNDPQPCIESDSSAIIEIMRSRSANPDSLKNLEEAAYDLPDGPDVDFFSTPNFLIKYQPLNLQDVPLPQQPETRSLWDDCSQLGGSILPDARSQKKSEPVPVRIQEIALIAEESLKFFRSKSLIDDNVILDLKRRSDGQKIWITVMAIPARGATAPHMNHFSINAQNKYRINLFAVPHELFHRIQYSYTSTVLQESSGMRGMFIEGGAMTAEDAFDTIPNCYMAFGQGEKRTPWLSLLDSPSHRSELSWAAGIFWKYFAEQCSVSPPALNGTCSSRKPWDLDSYQTILLQMTSSGGFQSVPRIAACPRQPNKSFYAIWIDHLVANALDGRRAGVAPFLYREESDPVLCPELEHVHDEVAMSRLKLSSTCITSESADPTDWSARYYEAEIAPNTSKLDVSFRGHSTTSDCTLRALSFATDGTIRGGDTDMALDTTTRLDVAGVKAVIFIVGCRSSSTYTIDLNGI